MVPILALSQIGLSPGKRRLGPGKEVHRTEAFLSKHNSQNAWKETSTNLSVVLIPCRWSSRTFYVVLVAAYSVLENIEN